MLVIDVKKRFYVFYSCHVFLTFFNVFLFSQRFFIIYFKNVHQNLKILPRTSRRAFQATQMN